MSRRPIVGSAKPQLYVGAAGTCAARKETLPMVVFSLREQSALEESVRGGQVAGKAYELHHRILVHREALIAQGSHVAVRVGAEEQVLGVQHIHAVHRRTAAEAAIE